MKKVMTVTKRNTETYKGKIRLIREKYNFFQFKLLSRNLLINKKPVMRKKKETETLPKLFNKNVFGFIQPIPVFQVYVI